MQCAVALRALSGRAARLALAALARHRPGLGLSEPCSRLRRGLARPLPASQRRAPTGVRSRHLRAPGDLPQPVFGKDDPLRHRIGRRRPALPGAPRCRGPRGVHRSPPPTARAALTRATAPPAPRGGGVRLPWPADLRQNADVHERRWSPSCSNAPARTAYRRSTRTAHRALARRIASPRPLYSPHVRTGQHRRAGDPARMAREAHQRYGTAGSATASSPRPTGSRTCSSWRCCSKETGLLDPRAATLAVNRSRCSRPSATCRTSGR